MENLHENLAIIQTSLKLNETDHWEHHVSFEMAGSSYKLVLESPSPRLHAWIKGLRFEKDKTLNYCYSLRESCVIWDMLSEKRFKVIEQKMIKAS